MVQGARIIAAPNLANCPASFDERHHLELALCASRDEYLLMLRLRPPRQQRPLPRMWNDDPRVCSASLDASVTCGVSAPDRSPEIQKGSLLKQRPALPRRRVIFHYARSRPCNPGFLPAHA